MAWLCVDENGQEMIFDNKPYRDISSVGGYWNRSKKADYCNVDLPKGTIKKLIGKELTWEDEPYKFILQDEDKDYITTKKKKFNWKILLLAIIWSLLFICLSNVAMDLKGVWKLIAIIIITALISVVFYFGYRDFDTTSDYTEDEKDFFNKKS